jgi:hypothetical protein
MEVLVSLHRVRQPTQITCDSVIKETVESTIGPKDQSIMYMYCELRDIRTTWMTQYRYTNTYIGMWVRPTTEGSLS